MPFVAYGMSALLFQKKCYSKTVMSEYSSAALRKGDTSAEIPPKNRHPVHAHASCYSAIVLRASHSLIAMEYPQ